MRSEPDPIGDAIAALTDAARGIRIIGPPGTSNEHSGPVDFGEIACHVLTSVAANLGGVENLLAGRPGSWEADYVRQIVLSTAGDSAEALLRWRSQEPPAEPSPTSRARIDREHGPVIGSKGVRPGAEGPPR